MVYRDTGNCPPSSVKVTISGVGTYALTGAGSNWDGGVTFARNVAVSSAGTHTYSFTASSGSGAGAKTVTLTGVRPGSFSVVAPTPKPTPKPTQPPTAVPTPQPTPIPTPAVTTGPTSSPSTPSTKQPGPSSTAKASGTPPDQTGQPSPRGGVVVSGSSGPGTSALGGSPSARPTRSPLPGAAGEGFQFTPPPALVRFAEWAAITAGGLILFMLLVIRGRRRAQESFISHSRVALAPTSDPPSSAAQRVPSRTRRRDEENMPRWLRPSVQAARQGRFTDE